MLPHQLSSARLVLERARLLLREQPEDTSACELLGAVSEVIHAIAVAEASSKYDEAPWLLSRARALVERTRDYASHTGLHFLVALTPHPGQPMAHDTDRALSTKDILTALVGMKDGSQNPPPALMAQIREDQLLDDRSDTIPSPPETSPAFEPNEEETGKL